MTTHKPKHQCIGTDERATCNAMIDAKRKRCAMCAIEQDQIRNRQRAAAAAKQLRDEGPVCENCDQPTRRSCNRCGQRICWRCARNHPVRDYTEPVTPELWQRCTWKRRQPDAGPVMRPRK